MLADSERSLHTAAAGSWARPAAGLVEELTDRELAVLRLLPSGRSLRQIGAALYVSYNTVKTHVRRIYQKLAVSTRAEAVARARELDLL